MSEIIHPASKSGVVLIPFSELPEDRQQQVAEHMAIVTSTPDSHGKMPQMLSVKKDDVLGRRGVVALVDGEFGGYIGVMDPLNGPEDAKMAEIGTLWVEEKYRRHTPSGGELPEDVSNQEKRRQSIAGQLTQKATELTMQERVTPYGFCNGLSLGIFAALGYESGTLDDVPSEAAELCHKCPLKPKGQRRCCDTVMVYTK